MFRTEAAAGLVVGLALIPEAISFSVIVGVDPAIGPFTSTHNLAVGVVAGTVAAMVIFARRVARVADVRAVTEPGDGRVVYCVTGELFFASANDLVTRFDYAADPARIVIDLSAAHVWHASSVAALDTVTAKYAQRGKTVETTGLNEPSAEIHRTLSGELTGSH